MEVHHCNELANLVISSAAKSLKHLTNLWIARCDKTEHKIDDESLQAIKVFRITGFIKSYNFLHSCKIEFPGLEKVTVSACLKLKVIEYKCLYLRTCLLSILNSILSLSPVYSTPNFCILSTEVQFFLETEIETHIILKRQKYLIIFVNFKCVKKKSSYITDVRSILKFSDNLVILTLFFSFVP